MKTRKLIKKKDYPIFQLGSASSPPLFDIRKTSSENTSEGDRHTQC